MQTCRGGPCLSYLFPCLLSHLCPDPALSLSLDLCPACDLCRCLWGGDPGLGHLDAKDSSPGFFLAWSSSPLSCPPSPYNVSTLDCQQILHKSIIAAIVNLIRALKLIFHVACREHCLLFSRLLSCGMVSKTLLSALTCQPKSPQLTGLTCLYCRAGS